jgi:hypothetical protein
MDGLKLTHQIVVHLCKRHSSALAQVRERDIFMPYGAHP